MFDKLRVLTEPFGWFLTLGKSDADHVKQEVQDLLAHSSQSLKSLLELTDVLREIPANEFGAETFNPVLNHCFYVFTSPGAAQQSRTRCIDIQRDINRISFKMIQLLRAEDGDWKGIRRAFRDLLDADNDFLVAHEDELRRLGDELFVVEQLLDEDRESAWTKYQSIRNSLITSRRHLANAIQRMQSAERHVRSLLT